MKIQCAIQIRLPLHFLRTSARYAPAAMMLALFLDLSDLVR